jgi:hypothetical protein
MRKYKNNIIEFKKRDNTFSKKDALPNKRTKFLERILNCLAPKCILCEKRKFRLDMYVKTPISLCFICSRANNITFIKEYLVVPFRIPENILSKLTLEREYTRNG